MSIRTKTLDESKFSMFFLRPKKSLDVHAVARKLVSTKGVREVLITEGEYGFIVKASEDCHDRIFSAVSDGYRKVTCHYKYRRWKGQ